MLKLIHTVLLFAVATANKIENMNSEANPNGDNNINLHNLGRVGNKFYFVGREDAQFDWYSGRNYCESHGMTLASIDTQKELDFLSRSFIGQVFHGWHWTAARDARTSQQFVWDDTESGITISIPLVEIGVANGTYQTCGTYYIDAEKSGMAFHECSSPSGFTLCESE